MALPSYAGVATSSGVSGIEDARMFFDWDWDGSEAAFHRALALNPSYAQAHQWYAHLLATIGQADEALARVQHAARLDPLSPVIQWSVGFIQYLTRRYDDADETFARMLDMSPGNTSAHGLLAAIRYQQGRPQESAELHLQFLAGVGPPPEAVAAMRRALPADGPPDVWAISSELCAEAAESCPQGITIGMLVRLGRFDDALNAMESAYRRRLFSRSLADLVMGPDLDPIRGDPRFVRVLEQLDLPRIER